MKTKQSIKIVQGHTASQEQTMYNVAFDIVSYWSKLSIVLYN